MLSDCLQTYAKVNGELTPAVHGARVSKEWEQYRYRTFRGAAVSGRCIIRRQATVSGALVETWARRRVVVTSEKFAPRTAKRLLRVWALDVCRWKSEVVGTVLFTGYGGHIRHRTVA